MPTKFVYILFTITKFRYIVPNTSISINIYDRKILKLFEYMLCIMTIQKSTTMLLLRQINYMVCLLKCILNILPIKRKYTFCVIQIVFWFLFNDRKTHIQQADKDNTFI